MNDVKAAAKHFFLLLKYVILIALGALAVLAGLAALAAVIRHRSVLKYIYNTYYYFGGFALIFSIPLMIKRSPGTGKAGVFGRSKPMFEMTDILGDPYEDEAMNKSFEKFAGDTFWGGIFIVIFSIILFVAAAVVESFALK